MEKMEKWNKLLKLLDEEDFIARDFLALICSQLVDIKESEYKSTIRVGGKLFDVKIKRLDLQ